MARQRARHHYRPRTTTTTTTTTPAPTPDRFCQELRQISLEVQDKVDSLHQMQLVSSLNSAQEDGGGGGGGGGEEEVGEHLEPEQHLQHHQAQALDRHVVRLYRRIAAPFRKANRRLREMEAVKTEFDTVARSIEATVEGVTEDMDRR